MTQTGADRAAYMREYRTRPGVGDLAKARDAARHRALIRLAGEYPERYEQLRAEELELRR